MENQNNIPTQMEFTIASITQGIEYWLNNMVLKENVVVDKVIWNARDNKFLVNLANDIQVEQKL